MPQCSVIHLQGLLFVEGAIASMAPGITLLGKHKKTLKHSSLIQITEWLFEEEAIVSVASSS
jgi:hypothetical protein